MGLKSFQFMLTEALGMEAPHAQMCFLYSLLSRARI